MDIQAGIVIFAVTLLSRIWSAMKTKFTAKLLATLAPQEKAYRVHDTQQPGLCIRVLPSSHMSYMVTWGRNKTATLGRVNVVTLEQARREAARYLAEAHEHGEPLAITQARLSDAMPTLDAFLRDQFEPWALAHQRDGDNSVRAIRHSFADLLALPMDQVTQKRIEQVRTGWLAAGRSPATANRNVTRLKGLLSRAVDWGVLPEHPLAKVKRLKVDGRGRVRYLDLAEEQALRKALDDREESIRADRDSANAWRTARNRELLPDLRAAKFADHLKPLVLLSLNTGMRRGEVFNLHWRDVNFQGKFLTVEGETSKSGQTRHIPLNKEALSVLKAWRGDLVRVGFVFPAKDAGRLDNVKKSWDGVLKLAKVENFRWHDLRHTFASKLVMAGVALNTVRELLGHSDIAMTLRYAHLAPDTKAAAVELI